MKSTQELIQSILPLGFRFHPTDEELITQYLKKKVFSSTHFCSSLIAELDLYKFNPWELPDRALFGDDEWFFFTPRDRKYPNGVRPNRATSSGYWKATGTDKAILSSKGSQCIGVKKALVFYRGHPRKGSKTNWMMYEYRLLDQNNHSSRLRGSMRRDGNKGAIGTHMNPLSSVKSISPLLDDWVLCRIRHRNNTTNKFSHNNPTIISSYLEDDNIDVIKKPNTFNDRDKSYVVEKEVFVDECVPLDLKQQTSCQYFGAPTTYDQPIVQQYCSMTDVLATMRRVLSVGTMDELFMPHNKLFQLSPVDSENSDIFDQS